MSSFILYFLMSTWGMEMPPGKYDLIGKKLPVFSLQNEDGDTLSEQDFRGQPLVVTFVYFSCPHTCSPLIKRLKSAALEIPSNLPFRLLTVTFDPKDTMERLRQARSDFSLPKNWTLARGTQTQVRLLMDSLDFRTVTLSGGDFAHPNVVYVFDKDSKLVSLLDGANIQTRELAESLLKTSSDATFKQRMAAFIFWTAGVLLLATLLFFGLAARR